MLKRWEGKSRPAAAKPRRDAISEEGGATASFFPSTSRPGRCRPRWMLKMTRIFVPLHGEDGWVNIRTSIKEEARRRECLP
jgi:hypothetical protein